MKQIKTILACGLVLAVTGLTTLVVAAGGQKEQKATVRSIHGRVQYKTEGGDWMPLKVNQELTQGATLKSDPGADAYLQVNGFTSTVKLTESTTIKLEKMLANGGFGGDSTTDLKLDGGKVLGSVRKLSADSEYQVAVPNGVAGIRGTDFEVSVTVNESTGAFSITFTSVTGTVVCQVSTPQTGQASATLTSGQSWTVTGQITNGVATTLNAGTVTTLTTGELATLVAQLPPPPTTIANLPVITVTPFVPPTESPSDTSGSSNANTAQ